MVQTVCKTPWRLAPESGQREEHTLDLASLIALEAGRTLNDGVDEVREAVDFCRYYAAQAEALMDSEIELPGVTGEANRLRYHASGPGSVSAHGTSHWRFS